MFILFKLSEVKNGRSDQEGAGPLGAREAYP